MATYVIGDVQGCLAALDNLLLLLGFNPAHDALWFVGDLVNRGPHSLETLRFIKSLGDAHIAVLGNHDLSLIASAYGVKEVSLSDTIHGILSAPDKHDLIDWLRTRPLLHYDAKWNAVMTHAGLAPMWELEEAQRLAREVEIVLRSDKITDFLSHMYGNMPDKWDEQLQGTDRLRCITNYLTRLRYCYADGRMDFAYKGGIADKPAELVEWFKVPKRKNTSVNIIFGHWAALNGENGDVKNIYPLDTGCVWGNCLTAMRLEDKALFNVKCR